MDTGDREDPKPPIDRRAFLRRGAASGLGLTGLALAPLLEASEARADATSKQGEAASRVRRHVRLGRTELEISDIGFGASRLRDGQEHLVEHALERGIDYFDTAEGYENGASERTLGKALGARRKDVVLVSKTITRARDSVATTMASLDASLRRLRTDWIDVYLNHAVNDPARMKSDAWGEFVERARSQGKIRFTGMSGHGGRLVESIDAALERDLADVLLVAHNFGQDPRFHERLTRRLDFVATQPELPDALVRARKKDVGVVAMKTLMGARLNDLRPYEREGSTFMQAAFRWVLTSGHAHALIISMKSRELIDEALGASGATSTRSADRDLLDRYYARNAAGQCRYGCNDCEASCPAGVAIEDVLRTRMYAADYGDVELGEREYARIEHNAAACASCTTQACTQACRFDLPVADLARDAHRRLHGATNRA